MKISGLVLLGAATLSVAQLHNHVHKHPARHGSPLEGRDSATTTTIAGPVVTVYELNGETLTWDEVEAGLKSGKYVISGDTISSVVSSAAPSTSTTPASTAKPTTSTSTLTSTSSSSAAKFLEQKSTSSSSTSTTPTSTIVAAATSSTSTPAAAATTASSASSSSSASAADSASDSSASSSSSSSSTDISATFPNDEISCDDFDSVANYGAVAADYLGLSGWIGVQKTPNYTEGDSSISDIETAVSGETCSENSFCSYMCPDGYQKAHWPSAQGSSGQSIGGLYCNKKGMLERTRSGYNTLCQKGVGSITAKNTLSKVVAVCRTDYPGTESETVATSVGAGDTASITCPDSSTYYKWEGSSTTAQYYINPSGTTTEEGCQWGTSGSNIGNWAPVNMGLGKDTSGYTYLSLFPNSPTNTDGKLDFKIKITGDVSGNCSYSNGQYYSNGVASSSGCTISVTGDAVVEFY